MKPSSEEPRHAALDTAPREKFRTAEPRTPSLERVIYVTGSSVRVRSGPGTTYDRITAFKRGYKLVFTGDADGKWRKVRWGEATGWMHGDYLSFDAPSADTTAAKIDAAKTRGAGTRETRTRKARGPSDAALRKEIIRRSLAAYPGNCPCPYNRDRAGRKCGKRSAWSRPGGRSPICYDSDVTPSMLARARR